MKLTEEQKRRIYRGPIECPVCNESNWALDPYIYEYPDFQYLQNRTSIPALVMPVVVLYCNNCKHCISFNAVELGIVGQDGNRGETKSDIKQMARESISFRDWLNNAERRYKFILLLVCLVIFFVGIWIGSTGIVNSFIINASSITLTNKMIGWVSAFLGVLLLALSAYLIDIGSRNPLINVTDDGSMSMATSAENTKKLQRNKKLHKFGMGTLVLGLILSAIGLILAVPN